MKTIYQGEIGPTLSQIAQFAIATTSTLTLVVTNPNGVVTVLATNPTLTDAASGAWSYAVQGDEFAIDGDWIAQLKVVNGTTTLRYGAPFVFRVATAPAPAV